MDPTFYWSVSETVNENFDRKDPQSVIEIVEVFSGCTRRLDRAAPEFLRGLC